MVATAPAPLANVTSTMSTAGATSVPAEQSERVFVGEPHQCIEPAPNCPLRAISMADKNIGGPMLMHAIATGPQLLAKNCDLSLAGHDVSIGCVIAKPTVSR